MPETLVRFTASAGDSPEKPAVYLLRKPGIFDRIRWQSDCTAAGARSVGDEELRACLRDAIQSVLEGEERDRALADLELVTSTTDRLTNLKQGEDRDIPDGFVDALGRVTKLEDLAIREWPAYASARAAREYWWTMSRFLAAKYFLAGVVDAEGKEVIFPRKHSLSLDESVLEGLPRGDVFEVGLEAMTLMRRR